MIISQRFDTERALYSGGKKSVTSAYSFNVIAVGRGLDAPKNSHRFRGAKSPSKDKIIN
jgi:hypothetical protein